jgi:hypothetical protein
MSSLQSLDHDSEMHRSVVLVEMLVHRMRAGVVLWSDGLWSTSDLELDKTQTLVVLQRYSPDLSDGFTQGRCGVPR